MARQTERPDFPYLGSQIFPKYRVGAYHWHQSFGRVVNSPLFTNETEKCHHSQFVRVGWELILNPSSSNLQKCASDVQDVCPHSQILQAWCSAVNLASRTCYFTWQPSFLQAVDIERGGWRQKLCSKYQLWPEPSVMFPHLWLDGCIDCCGSWQQMIWSTCVCVCTRAFFGVQRISVCSTSPCVQLQKKTAQWRG